MSDAKLMQLGPCELAWRSLNEIKRAFELGYDPEARCDQYDHSFRCFRMIDYLKGEINIDWSLLSSVHKNHMSSGRLDNVIHLLEFIKKYSKRQIVVIRDPDIIFYPQEKYLVLNPARINFWAMASNFIFHDPIFKFCVENDFIIARSAFIQTNLIYFQNASNARRCICNHEERIRMLCIACRNYNHLVEFKEIVANLTKKQTSLFELLYNKLHFL
jgi:hypothetical protein